MWSPKYKSVADRLFADRQGAGRYADVQQLTALFVKELEVSETTALQLASEVLADRDSGQYFWMSPESLSSTLEARVAELHEVARRQAIEELRSLRAAVQERIAAHRAQTEMAAKTAARMAADWEALSASISTALDVLTEGPRT